MKHKLNKKFIYRFLSISLIIILFCACGFSWGWHIDSGTDPSVAPVVYKSNVVNAGEYAEFEIRFQNNIQTTESYTDRLIVAVAVPKVWNPRDEGNIEMTWQCVSDEQEPQPMDIIPVGTLPVRADGTWENVLLNLYGVGPNVSDDIQWVAFIARDSYTQSSGDKNYKANIKVKTSSNNLSAKIGFALSHEKDGGASGESGIGGNWYGHDAVIWGECLEVVNGEGDLIDFCEFHLNAQTPGMSTQNDILTLKYVGDIVKNALYEEAEKNDAEIYLKATATTKTGKKIEVTERMIKEGTWGLTYSKTFWPEGLFEIAKDEALDTIEYYFTNKDGSQYISAYDDENKVALQDNPNYPGKPIEPFIFRFQ
jgi:hypothetical protein